MRRYHIATFAWAVGFLAAKYLVAFEVVEDGLAWAIAVMPSLLALWPVLAFVRYLRDADEMQRLIELQALALAVFAGFVVWPGLTTVRVLGAPVEKVSELLPMVMIVAYIVGVMISRRRFR